MILKEKDTIPNFSTDLWSKVELPKKSSTFFFFLWGIAFIFFTRETIFEQYNFKLEQQLNNKNKISRVGCE